MSATEFEDTAAPLPRISEIRALPDFRLAIVWAAGSRTGRADFVDLAPVINTYKLYRPLRNNEELFRTARLVDHGNVVEWGDGTIDMPAELIKDLANEAMTSLASYGETTSPKKLPPHFWGTAGAKSKISLARASFRASSLLHAMGTKHAAAPIRNVSSHP